MCRIAKIALCLLAAVLPAAAAAQSAFPSRPVRVIVPYPAGGIVDVVSRVVTEKLGALWNQPIVTEARPGANSNIGTDLVAKAPADGYTWLITGPAITANPFLGTNAAWDPKRDFVGLGVAAWSAAAIVVPAASPANSLREFVALAKARPLNYGNPGTGSSIHLSTELFKQVAGINLQAVGYKGQPQIITDLLGGQLDVAFAATGLVAQHVQAGKLKALGVIGRERVRQFPGVPTLIEAGYPEAGVTAWYAFFARAGTPREVLERINADIGRVLAMPDVRERMEKLGGEAAQPMSLAEMSRMIAADTDRWAAVIRAGNIKAE
ncbi:MAG: tripartite tricarboxylate transporter substrate binding protein [Burkholderiales bacterium]|nr:tripartite tricarboxylate transporter substrate binding protein [Burkholderiales bacterium]